MRYAIWNNKGGVGKSFLTFVLACEYAHNHAETPVYIIDMCPQANVSEIVLGGNSQGAEHLENIINHGGGNRQTIGGYFDRRLNQPQNVTGDEVTFAIEAHEHNDSLPQNIHLVAGDPSLEVQAEAINQLANLSLPKETWKNVHSWLKDLVDSIGSRYPGAVFFIDCNPSFSAYTELAIVAAEKLIVPCTADGSSARAITNIGQLIYGHNIPKQYEDTIFAKRVVKEGLSVPSLHMVLLNRSTQYNNQASKAFGAMFDNIKSKVQDMITSEPRSRGISHGQDLFFDIPDTHSVAIVASHTGTPVYNIKIGKYEVHGEHPQVNKEPLARYQKAVSEVAKRL